MQTTIRSRLRWPYRWLYGWLAGQYEISCKYWSDPQYTSLLACLGATWCELRIREYLSAHISYNDGIRNEIFELIFWFLTLLFYLNLQPIYILFSISVGWYLVFRGIYVNEMSTMLINLWIKNKTLKTFCESCPFTKLVHVSNRIKYHVISTAHWVTVSAEIYYIAQK